ncbi:MAG: glycine cleavage system protein H [Planctomycetes bacterium]|nr:glycine cleavage system protein H [Planctomycetota bacterium]HJO27173.1 glycine cleavage system protein GcvH [Planctomycetota bacterium]
MMVPEDRKYASSHEWIKMEGDTALIGISAFAVTELSNGNEGDMVYCDLPEVGRVLATGETFGEIESVKAVGDLNAPVGGEVLEVNTNIEDHLEILCSDPWKTGWLIRIKPETTDWKHLLDAEAYEGTLAEQA